MNLNSPPTGRSMKDLFEEYLELAVQEAILQWQGKEGELSRQLQNKVVIDSDFLRGWLGHWMLARSNPIRLRAQLSDYLQEIRPLTISASPQDLPGMVIEHAGKMKTLGATKGVQTSLVSKFTFSLAPETIVPYDKRARDGLGRMFNMTIREHDYPEYLKAFHRFKDICDKYLDESGLEAEYKNRYEQSGMSEQLFRMRVADKMLMIIGGFDPKLMGK
jgi:hypothetical protein